MTEEPLEILDPSLWEVLEKRLEAPPGKPKVLKTRVFYQKVLEEYLRQGGKVGPAE